MEAAQQNQDDPSQWKNITFDIAGFYTPKSGAQLVGKLVAYRHNKKFGRNYFLIELLRPCPAISAEDRTKTIELEAGQVIWVNESDQLKDLVYYVNQESKVSIKPLAKKELQGGRSVWRMEVKLPPGVRKGQRAEAIDHTANDKLPEGGKKPGEDGADDDDIPF